MVYLVHQGALGDWVLTFPLLRALGCRGEPVAAVTAWSKAQLAAALFGHVRPVNIETDPWPRLHAVEGVAAPVERLHDAGLILSFVSTGRDDWARNMHRAAPQARLECLSPRPPADWKGSAYDWVLHQARGAIPGLADAGQALPASAGIRGGPVVVHPGSGGRHKCWPPERWATLLRSLRDRGLPVRVLLGEVELEQWPARRLEEWRRDWEVCVPPDLPALHAAMRDARLYLGNDAGPTHLAAQLGLPTLALFGPTDPRVWAPVGPAVEVLAPSQSAAMDCLAASVVLAACLRRLE